MNNTQNHISDQASTILLDITNTPFDSSVENLQDALDLLGPHSLEDGLPLATFTTAGILEIATNTDIDEGTANNMAVSPEGLAYALANPGASETEVGWTRYSTNTEAENDSLDNVATTPKNVHHLFETRLATETLSGTSRLSTRSQAEVGSNNTTVMTPLRVKQAIDAQIPNVAEATESVVGTVELATTAEAISGTIRDGMAISPYTFARANATESAFGTARIATQSETNSLTSDTRVVTPAKLAGLNATTTSKGLVELATDSETKALNSSSRAVTPSGLNSLNAGTSSKGLVEIATTTEAKALSETSKVLTPHALNVVRATSSDPSQYGLTRLSNSLTSTSQTASLSSYGAKLLNDRVVDLENTNDGWETIVDYGRSHSTSYIVNVNRDLLDGYEFQCLYINSGNELRVFKGMYSSYFNYGNTTRIYEPGGNDGDPRYEINNERFDLSYAENKVILVMRRRIPWLPFGYDYTGTSGSGSGGSGGGDTGGGSGGGGTGGGGGGSIDPYRGGYIRLL